MVYTRQEGESLRAFFRRVALESRGDRSLEKRYGRDMKSTGFRLESGGHFDPDRIDQVLERIGAKLTMSIEVAGPGTS